MKVLENGNTTVYEWRYCEAPLRIEEPVLIAELEAPTSTDDAVKLMDQKCISIKLI